MTDIEILHIITSSTRYKLILLLSEGHYSIQELAEKLGTSELAVSQQIKILKECGVIRCKKIDDQICYTLNHDMVLRIGSSFEESISNGITV